MELCGGSNRHQTLRAVAPCVLAEITFQEMNRFVEGLGLKKAKSVSKIIADIVLENVKTEQSRRESEDRMKIQVIGSQGRRMAFCAPSPAQSMHGTHQNLPRSISRISDSSAMSASDAANEKTEVHSDRLHADA